MLTFIVALMPTTSFWQIIHGILDSELCVDFLRPHDVGRWCFVFTIEVHRGVVTGELC